MIRHFVAIVFFTTWFLAYVVATPGFSSAQNAQSVEPKHSASEAPPEAAAEAPPSDAEVNARAQDLVANQHRDDQALIEYERIEHHIDLTGGPDPEIIKDKTYRIVPTGTGTLRILLRDHGAMVDSAEYHRQLQAWQDVLERMLRTEDQTTKAAYEKYDKRNRQRAQLVDSMLDSFSAKWLSRETLNDRSCEVFELSPKPDFHPRSMMQEAFSHIKAKIWVDRETNQMVRGEAHILRDISFGGGIVGKVFHGGVFSMEQAEVVPGIWEPTRYQYDFRGRKFLFSFDEHQVVETRRYHWIGPPKDALAVVQNELSTGNSIFSDP